MWIVGSQVDYNPTDGWPMIVDGCLIEFFMLNVNSVNKSIRFLAKQH